VTSSASNSVTDAPYFSSQIIASAIGRPSTKAPAIAPAKISLRTGGEGVLPLHLAVEREVSRTLRLYLATQAKCQTSMSEFGSKADSMCSERVFRLLTQIGMAKFDQNVLACDFSQLSSFSRHLP